MNIEFSNIDDTFIEDCFKKAATGFKPLEGHTLILAQKSIPKTNMRAQPILNAAFFNKKTRAYKIEISNHINFSQYIKIEDIPKKVLVGWFAHELGHVMDYLHRSAWNMIHFGIGYWLFPTFRVGAERKADLYAIENGFANEVLATKKFILDHSELPNIYKKRIEKYYMSPDEVSIILQQEADDNLTIDQAF
jgi:hypothetical protein